MAEWASGAPDTAVRAGLLGGVMGAPLEPLLVSSCCSVLMVSGYTLDVVAVLGFLKNKNFVNGQFCVVSNVETVRYRLLAVWRENGEGVRSESGEWE